MLRLPKIAVTGGLACGKSTACRFFAELGARVVSADEIVHQLLSSNSKLEQQVIDLLGTDIINNHQIDRKRVAKKVFNNSKLLQSLERILHPAVREEINRIYQSTALEDKFPLFVVEIPLLFEAGGEEKPYFHYDYSVAVLADPKVCKDRFSANKEYAANEYEQRASKQMSHTEKATHADFVIMNNGSLEDLQIAVEKLFNFFVNPNN